MSLEWFHTGAAAEGAVQASGDASIGGLRSATLPVSLEHVRYGAMPGLRIDYVAGANGTGIGSITAETEDAIKWTPPGEETGAAVTIANGETKTLAGDDLSRYIVVTRTSATGLAGSEAVQLIDVFGNAIGGSDFDDDERAAGETKYRGLIGKNIGALNVTGLTVALKALAPETAATNAAANTGAATLEGDFEGWPTEGFCERLSADGTSTREIVYYASRTDSALTVESGGREQMGTSAANGLIGEKLRAIPAARFAEATVTSGAIEAIDDEYDAPTGVTWNATTRAVALTTPLAAGAMTGLWIERICFAGRGGSANEEVALTYGFTYDGEAYTGELRGRFRVAEDALEGYLLYVDPTIAANGDIAAAPDETFSTLPYTTTLTLDADAQSRVLVRRRNRYGLISRNADSTLFRIDAEGEEAPTPPQGPAIQQVRPGADGEVVIEAQYHPFTEADADDAATHWLIYVTADDTAPLTATPIEVAMAADLGPRQLIYTTDGLGALEGAPVRVVVRTRRVWEVPAEDPEDPPVEMEVDSENTAESTTTATAWGPTGPTGLMTQGQAWAFPPVAIEAPDETVVIDAGKNVYWEVLANETRLWADTVLVWNLRLAADGTHEILTVFGVDANDFNEAASGTDPVEFGTWDGSEKEIFLQVAGTRLMRIDVEAETIQLSALDRTLAAIETVANEPVWPRYDATCLQVWDDAAKRYVTGVALDTDGVLRLSGVGWVKKATQEECL